MTTFHSLGLAEPVLNAVLAEGYETPTPIQSKAIPVIMNGRDVIGIAQTGTGKTAAFVLPQLHALATDRRPAGARSATVLMLAPTRELANQIAASIRTYGRKLKPTVAIVIGGARPGPQIKVMKGGVDFLVATPGRLLDHMQSGAIDLASVKSVVLDEGDQMLDMGFIPTIRKIMEQLPERHQTLLFSATMPKPIRKLASDFLHSPQEISVAPASKPIERIAQSVVFIEKQHKPKLLAQMLRERTVERAVVFTRTKHGANRLCQQLEKAGIDAQPIHGNKSQNQREKTLAAFRKGVLPVLVATDIAARGIDIDDVSHVFNYELPNVPEVYVHRIGRTARAGKMGQAVAFCDASERPFLRDIEKLTGLKLPVMASDMPGSGAESIVSEQPASPDNDRGHAPSGRKKRRGGKSRSLRGSGEKQRNKPARAKGNKRRKPATAGSRDDAGLQRMLGNINAVA